MNLSILIATIPERKQLLNSLLDKLFIDTEAFDGIETIIDNSPRYDEKGGLSVGKKRQALVEKAKGKYIWFLDDDDNYSSSMFNDLMPLLENDYDVICANVTANIDGVPHRIDQSIHFQSEQLQQGVTKRYPSVMAIYKRANTINAKFPDLNNGEDFPWTSQLNLKTEYKTNGVWHIYNYDSNKTVASSAERKAIVTFSNTPRYDSLAEIQKQSCKEFAPQIDHFHFRQFEEIGSKPHSEYPYAFKPHSIHKVREMGYNNILWLDSPVHFIKDSNDIFQYIRTNNILLFDNIGWSIGSYTHNECLAHFNISREEANDSKMVMACAMGFNFNNASTRNVFDTYLAYAHTNAYQGSWENHRHDQSVISCIAKNKGVPLLHPNSTFIAYNGNEGHLPHAESVCLISG